MGHPRHEGELHAEARGEPRNDLSAPEQDRWHGRGGLAPLHAGERGRKDEEQRDEDGELGRADGEGAAREAEGKNEAQDAQRGDDAPRDVEAAPRGPGRPPRETAPRQVCLVKPDFRF